MENKSVNDSTSDCFGYIYLRLFVFLGKQYGMQTTLSFCRQVQKVELQEQHGGIMMKKGYYYFGECGSMEKILLAIGIIAAVISCFFLFKGGYLSLIDDDFYFTTYNAWFLFFLSISIFAFIADICLHKICEDIAKCLKQIEENEKN